MNRPEFRTTRYTVISYRNPDDEDDVRSYCSMGIQKFYVDDVDKLDKIKTGYLRVIELHKKAMEDKTISSLESKLEVQFK